MLSGLMRVPIAFKLKITPMVINVGIHLPICIIDINLIFYIVIKKIFKRC